MFLHCRVKFISSPLISCCSFVCMHLCWDKIQQDVIMVNIYWKFNSPILEYFTNEYFTNSWIFNHSWIFYQYLNISPILEYFTNTWIFYQYLNISPILEYFTNTWIFYQFLNISPIHEYFISENAGQMFKMVQQVYAWSQLKNKSHCITMIWLAHPHYYETI